MINSGDKQFLSILVSRPRERDKQRREVNSLIAEINLFLLSIESHFLLDTAPSKNDPQYYNSLLINNTKGSSYEFDRFIDLDNSIQQIKEKVFAILREKA